MDLGNVCFRCHITNRRSVSPQSTSLTSLVPLAVELSYDIPEGPPNISIQPGLVLVPRGDQWILWPTPVRGSPEYTSVLSAQSGCSWALWSWASAWCSCSWESAGASAARTAAAATSAAPAAQAPAAAHRPVSTWVPLSPSCFHPQSLSSQPCLLSAEPLVFLP